MIYRARRRDANHAEIVRALLAAGCSVVDLSAVGIEGVPDLLVGYRARSVLLEIKAPDARGRLSSGAARSAERQAEWRAKWRGGPVFVVRSPEEAISAVTLAPGSPIAGGPDS